MITSGQKIKVIETSEKSNDDSLDMDANKEDNKEGGQFSSINASQISRLKNTRNSEAISAINSNNLSVIENVDNKFSIKVMDELQGIYTTALDDIKSASSVSIQAEKEPQPRKMS